MAWFHWFQRNWQIVLQRLAISVGFLGLLASLAILFLEYSWSDPKFDDDAARVFQRGTIGTEFIPLPVFQVLPDIFPQYFQPNPGQDWIDHFGFIRRVEPGDTPDNFGLPVGFCVTNYQPSSASPSPVKFIGLTCAACHSVQFRKATDSVPRDVIFGAGNADLDLIPFFESFRASLLLREPNEKGLLKLAKPPTDRPFNMDAPDLEDNELQHVLNLGRIEAELKKKSITLGLIERFFISQWLSAVQTQALKTTPKYDYPFWGWKEAYEATPANPPADCRLAIYNLIGPGRTQPFKTLLNSVLNLPVNHNRGFSKIPAIFNQEQWVWSQFDGSIKNHTARSALAAMTAGATPDSLDQPELAHDIRKAAEFTRTARCKKTFAEYFNLSPEQSRVKRGAQVYESHCFKCHGGPVADRPDFTKNPTGATWMYEPEKYGENGSLMHFKPDDPQYPGLWHGRLVPDEWLKTDPYRINFRYGDIASFQLYRRFTFRTQMGHPYEEFGGYPVIHLLEFKREEIRFTGAYVNGPIDGTFARSPYLHNASIPTLAQLINLKPRPPVFYRGKNSYDINDVGLDCPTDKPDAERYYKFDTGLPGNSNAGHDYPWKFHGPGWNKDQLEDLLEFLKTL